MSDEPEWFAPKRYGIGSGLPISWQGWVVLLAYLALLGLASFLIPISWVGYACAVVMLTTVLTLICMKTTRGGWHWRWGKHGEE